MRSYKRVTFLGPYVSESENSFFFYNFFFFLSLSSLLNITLCESTSYGLKTKDFYMRFACCRKCDTSGRSHNTSSQDIFSTIENICALALNNPNQYTISTAHVLTSWPSMVVLNHCQLSEHSIPTLVNNYLFSWRNIYCSHISYRSNCTDVSWTFIFFPIPVYLC